MGTLSLVGKGQSAIRFTHKDHRGETHVLRRESVMSHPAACVHPTRASMRENLDYPRTLGLGIPASSLLVHNQPSHTVGPRAGIPKRSPPLPRLLVRLPVVCATFGIHLHSCSLHPLTLYEAGLTDKANLNVWAIFSPLIYTPATTDRLLAINELPIISMHYLTVCDAYRLLRITHLVSLFPLRKIWRVHNK